MCLCREGYSGDNCELSAGLANPCSPNPCQNGGQCSAMDNKPVCSCPEEFEGEFCEIARGGGGGGGGGGTGTGGGGGGGGGKSPCHPNPCMNGGTCRENGGGYDCTCVTQYSGPNCEIDECEKCDVNALCVNGHCKCKSGYYGNGYQCEKEEESECQGCSPFAQCLNGLCICIEHYVGDGYNCNPVTTCNNCPPPNTCLQGSCVPVAAKKTLAKNVKQKRYAIQEFKSKKQHIAPSYMKR